jgi:hypothetical protein
MCDELYDCETCGDCAELDLSENDESAGICNVSGQFVSLYDEACAMHKEP